MQTPFTPQTPTAPRPTPSSTPATPSLKQGKPKKESKSVPWLLRLLKFLLLLAGGFLLFANVEPYVAITRLVFPSGGNVCRELVGLPVLGGLLASVCGFFASIIYSLSGFVVWAIFQAFELLPVASNFNVPFLSGLLARLEKAPQVTESEGDRPSVRAAKTKINTIVERSYSMLLTWAWVSYIADLALMSWLYSPLDKIGNLNPMGLVRVLLGVFGVELVILGVVLLNNVIDPDSVKHQTADKKPVREY